VILSPPSSVASSAAARQILGQLPAASQQRDVLLTRDARWPWCMAGAFRWAHAVAPRYRRERHDVTFERRSGEVVKSPPAYGLRGGDCDDDVAACLSIFGPAASPVFFGDPVRHIGTVVGFGRDSAIVDRVPGAPRWRRNVRA